MRPPLRTLPLWLPLTALALAACTKPVDPEASEGDRKSSASPSGQRADEPKVPSPVLPGRSVVEGRVRLLGEVQLPPLPTNPSVAATCGEQLEDPSVKVGAGGGLQEALIFLDVPAGPVLPQEVAPVLDQRGCRYSPAVLAARAGSTLAVRNSDPLVHNVRSVAKGRSLFNVAMPLEGMTLKRQLPAAPEVVAVHCDLHPWMRATVRTFAHGYVTATDEEGRFKLEGLPEGTRTVRVWHPRLPEQSFELQLDSQAPRSLDVTWNASQLQPL